MTEREAMAKVGRQPPDFLPDVQYRYILDWFWALKRFNDPTTDPIMPSTLLNWFSSVGILPSSFEVNIIYETDFVFRTELKKKIDANDKYMRDKA